MENERESAQEKDEEEVGERERERESKTLRGERGGGDNDDQNYRRQSGQKFVTDFDSAIKLNPF